MSRPKARVEGLTTIERGDSLFVHDGENGRTHELNATAAAVYKACDGQADPAELATRLTGSPSGADGEDLVLSALSQLGRAGLLESAFPAPPGVTRRRFVGTSLMAPLIITVVTPGRAAAASGDGTDLVDSKDNDGFAGTNHPAGDTPKDADTADGDGAGAKDSATPSDGGTGVVDGAGAKLDG